MVEGLWGPSKRVSPESRWENTVLAANVEEALDAGQPIQAAAVRALKSATDAYLMRITDTHEEQQSPKWEKSDAIDSSLITLLNGVSKKERREGLVLACLHRLSKAEATQQLAQLIRRTRSTRYLCCVIAARQFSPDVVSFDEAQLADHLIQLRMSSNTDFSGLVHVAQHMASNQSVVLSRQIIDLTLSKSKTKEYCRVSLQHLLDRGHLKTAFDRVSWLSSLPSSEGNDMTATVLDEYFSNWRIYSKWAPDVDRIAQWEACHPQLDVKTWKKLGFIFLLEGPDFTGSGQATWSHVEPFCYEIISLPRRDQDTLHRLLRIGAHAAGHGREAVESFVSACIDKEPSLETLLLLEESAAESGSLSSFRPGVQLHGLLPNLETLNLWQRTSQLSATLPNFQELAITSQPGLVEKLVEVIESTFEQAQAQFRSQLYEVQDFQEMAVLIHQLTTAVRRSHEIIRHSLPADGRAMHLLQCRLPCLELVGRAYEQMVEFVVSYSREQARGPLGWMKAHLSETLGGTWKTAPPAPRSLGQQVLFWEARSPGSDIADLAGRLASFRAIGYNLYVASLEQMTREPEFSRTQVYPCLCQPPTKGLPELASRLARRRRRIEEEDVVMVEADNDDERQRLWLSILICLIQEQGSNFISDVMATATGAGWLHFLQDLRSLTRFAQGSELAVMAGFTLTTEDVAWLVTLDEQYGQAVSFLEIVADRQARQGVDAPNLRWLWTAPKRHVMELLDECRQPELLLDSEIHLQLIRQISDDGANLPAVSGCITALHLASPVGQRLCANLLARAGASGNGTGGWARSWLEVMALVVRRADGLDHVDQRAVMAASDALQLTPHKSPGSFGSISRMLVGEVDGILERAQTVQALHMRMRRVDPDITAAQLASIGVVEEPSSSPSSFEAVVDDPDITDAMADAVSVVGEGEYEMAFSLAGLSELQRKARGVPAGCRSVVVRVALPSQPFTRFSIHLPDEATDHLHNETWRRATSNGARAGAPTCFLTGGARAAYHVFTQMLLTHIVAALDPFQVSSVATVFDAITTAVRGPPRTCVTCHSPVPVSRWAPATTCGASRETCDANAEALWQRSMGDRGGPRPVLPLAVRARHLVVEPGVADLILTCLYSVAANNNPYRNRAAPLPVGITRSNNLGLDVLLPGCPLSKEPLIQVLNSFPPLPASWSQEFSTDDFVRGNPQDGMVRWREDLLSWAAVFFRGFLVEATGRFLIPSLPGVRQFVLLDPPPERAIMFDSHLHHPQQQQQEYYRGYRYSPWPQAAPAAATSSSSSSASAAGGGSPVFHGTDPSRLLSILATGLRTMTGTAAQAHGASYGTGVYCAEEMGTSQAYCGSTGPATWRHGQLANRLVMLGCELKGYVAGGTHGSPTGFHVVAEDQRLLVRYVFLLPAGFKMPFRRHLETALSSAFAGIRSGM